MWSAPCVAVMKSGRGVAPPVRHDESPPGWATLVASPPWVERAGTGTRTQHHQCCERERCRRISRRWRTGRTKRGKRQKLSTHSRRRTRQRERCRLHVLSCASSQARMRWAIGIDCDDPIERRVSFSVRRDAPLVNEDHVRIVLDPFSRRPIRICLCRNRVARVTTP